MTREEKIALLIDELEDIRCNDYDADTDEDKTLKEAIRVIKASKQEEPCEDAISRQAVNTLVDELARAISDERCCMSRGRSTATIMQDILDLPPVNPQEPKTGHWINNHNGTYECDRCGKLHSRSNYCPNCGSRMVEPQEGEMGIEVVKTKEVEENGIKYLNINVSNSEVERNPNIVRLCSDVGILEYVKPKTGHWIEVIDEIDSLGNKTWHHKCSICGNENSGWGEYKFCPNCGACMKDCRTLDEFIEDSKESEGE